MIKEQVNWVKAKIKKDAYSPVLVKAIRCCYFFPQLFKRK
jgi:hypothetical protein